MRDGEGNDPKLAHCGKIWHYRKSRRELPRTCPKKNEHPQQKTANPLSCKDLTPANIDGVLMGWILEIPM
jgi:hypothetical protein